VCVRACVCVCVCVRARAHVHMYVCMCKYVWAVCEYVYTDDGCARVSARVYVCTNSLRVSEIKPQSCVVLFCY
jgi:hypothetical protein